MMNNISSESAASIPDSSKVAIQAKVTNKALENVKTVDSQSPKMIMLSGTSTAGKSSIMSELVRLHSNAVDKGIDDFSVDRTAFLMRTKFPKEYAILSKAVEDKYIRQLMVPNPVIIFKQKISEDDKKAVEDLIHKDNSAFWKPVGDMLYERGNFGEQNPVEENQEHFKELVNLAKTGKTVVFDTTKSEDFLEYLRKNPCESHQVQRFLVYVPLSYLVARVNGRNAESIKTGNVLNVRSHETVIRQFMWNYHPLKSKDDIVIDTIKRADIEKVFTDRRKQIAEETNSNGAALLNEVLTHFGFKVNDKDTDLAEVAITHDFQKFDGIFRTALAGQTPTQSATQLLTHTWTTFTKS